MALTTKHQVLAWDLVESLGDEAHKGIYFRLAKIYDETFLRAILSKTKEAFLKGIIKREDRGKYFMGILKKELERFKRANGKAKNNSKRKSNLKKKSRKRKRSSLS